MCASVTPQPLRMWLYLEIRWFFFFVFFNVYLLLREREREREGGSKGGAEREGDTEPEAGSRLRAVSTEPNAGLEPTNYEIMTRGLNPPTVKA